jgi:TonB-dependent starch-binding outer membrane protein SusC
MRRSIGVSAMVIVFTSSRLLAQGGTISGKVTSAGDGQAISGVTILVAGTPAGTQTKDDGRYTLSVQPGTYTVQARRIGYAPDSATSVVVTADASTITNFVLQPRATQLAQMVIVGYGTQSAKDVTGSIATVSTEEFNKGRIVNPEELIQAKVPGVQVLSNNEPGGEVAVRIRGGTSITASNDPLFVIDGAPIDVGGGVSDGRNPLSFLNPNDIESITVLKDASATAIYGTRGANGVVIITTKTGQPGSQVSYTVSTSAASVTREPQLLTAAQFRQAVETYAPQNIDSIGNANTNWQNAVQRTGLGQQHDLDFSGGRDEMRYRLGLGYLDQGGVVRGTDAQRVSLSFNYNDHFLKDQFELHANVKAARSHDDFTPGGVIGASISFAPTEPIFNSTGGYLQYANPLGTNNPIADLNQLYDQGISYRSVGDVEIAYHVPFVTGLTATVRAGYDYGNATRTTFEPSYSEGQLGAGGAFNQNNPSALNTLLETFGNYQHRFENLKSDLDITGGYTYEKFSPDSVRLTATGLITDGLGAGGIPASTSAVPQLNEQESLLISFFGRGTWTYNDRYTLMGSVRRDGSSRFGPANQWGVFPAIAGSWRIIDEDFMKNQHAFSDLKLRASWGVNGNQAFSNYLYLTTYQFGDAASQAQFGNQLVTTIRPTAVDPNIRWEETRSTDVGIDFGFMQNRLTGTLDGYTKKTTNLIFNVPVPAGTNLSNFVTTNIGAVQNRGLELGLNYRIKDGKDGALVWDANFNVSRNSNKLLSLYGGGSTKILTGGIAGGVGGNIEVLEPGLPINSFYTYQHKAVNPKNATVDLPDTALYVDQNGDGIINQDDLRADKSPFPKFIFGQSSQLSWRHFDGSYTLRAHVGNYVYNNVEANFGHYSAITGSTPPGNLSTSVYETNFINPQYFSDIYVQNASFLRMDNIQIGYTFPHFGSFKSFRVFGSVQNVFTITGYKGVDPEATTIGFTSNYGIDNTIYPRSRTYLLGAGINF